MAKSAIAINSSFFQQSHTENLFLNIAVLELSFSIELAIVVVLSFFKELVFVVMGRKKSAVERFLKVPSFAAAVVSLDPTAMSVDSVHSVLVGLLLMRSIVFK
jgi:hypothetical protein